MSSAAVGGRGLCVRWLSLVTIYRRTRVREHPRASSGHVLQHILIAEKALGKPLPIGAECHHADGDKRNNANRNLVICQNRDYHQFLHVRTRVVRAGGNPNTQRLCWGCKSLKPFDAFNKSRADKSYGLQSVCRTCQAKQYAVYERKPQRRESGADLLARGA